LLEDFTGPNTEASTLVKRLSAPSGDAPQRRGGVITAGFIQGIYKKHFICLLYL
jgi:hypothetical protein